MKIRKDEFKRIQAAPPLDMFLQGIKSPHTRDKYTRTLKQVLCKILEDILEGSFEERIAQIISRGKSDPDWLRDLLLNISQKLRERTELDTEDPEYYNPTSFNAYFKPLKKLFEMNDVFVQWKRIYVTFPELDNISETRGWNRSEIQTMLKFSKGTVDRAIILLAASSGIRAGGFDLNWGDLKPVYKKDGNLGFEKDGDPVCAMLYVYRGTSDSYPAFITPEAYEAILRYKATWTAEIGRAPEPEDPLFKLDGRNLKRMTLRSLIKKVTRILTQSGFRDTRKTPRRYEVPTMNGFRRFWNKACKESLSKESPLSSLIKKEFMMGHTGLVSLDKNYFKTHTMELAEEYLCAVPNLTMDDTIRLIEEKKADQERINRLEYEKDQRIEELSRMVKSLMVRIDLQER